MIHLEEEIFLEIRRYISHKSQLYSSRKSNTFSPHCFPLNSDPSFFIFLKSCPHPILHSTLLQISLLHPHYMNTKIRWLWKETVTCLLDSVFIKEEIIRDWIALGEGGQETNTRGASQTWRIWSTTTYSVIREAF